MKNLIESRSSRTKTGLAGRMELDFKKKRWDRTMHSKSFETEGERDRLEGSKRAEKLFHLMDENNRCLSD